MIRTSQGKKISVYRWALALGLGSSLVALGAANAQQANAPADETQSAERVIVTGSNIPSAAEVGGSEVTTIDQEGIVRTGTDDPETALTFSDPAFTGGGNVGSSNASIAAGNTNGGSEVSILGLPTLVLLDGRRLADSAALASGGAAFQDVNLFPASLIKKIEVLKDGASAIYGSDAVGGVVNVLLNNDFNGFEISGRYGFAEKGDISDNRESGIAGFGDDKTRIVVAAQYEQQDPILFPQRQWASSSFVSGFYGSNDGYLTSNFGGKISVAGSGLYLNTGLPVGLGGAVILKPGSIPTNLNSLNNTGIAVGSIPLQTFTTSTGATAQGFSASQLPAGAYSGTPNLANLGQEVGITLDQNRTNAYGSVERDIFDKLLTVFGSFIYSQNYSQSLLAPQPVATNSSPNASQNMVIPIGSPYNPFAATIGSSLGSLGSGTTASGSTAGGLVVTNRFLAEPRIFRNDTDFYRIVAGIKGDLFKDYNYELAFNHSQDEINFKNFGLIRSDLLGEALAGGYTASGTAQPAVITTAASGAQTVVTPAGPYSKVNGVLLPALDPFAFNNPASTEQAVTGTDIRDQLSTLTVIDGALNGFPVTLPRVRWVSPSVVSTATKA